MAGEVSMGITGLNEEVKKCQRCTLSESRTNAVCGEGDPEGRIMLVAQAPGKVEDARGRMFVGPSGKVLDELLSKANVSRNEVYMTNLIKCMLPKNRRPKREEIEACSQYLDREIALIEPELVAPLGYYATRYTLESYGVPVQSKTAFHELYGRLLLAGSTKILPLQHPAAVLHNPPIRQELEENYCKLKDVL
ncbi:MAG: uracil-DNA glycosylase [Methermicoccaceae archaeon]